jgi:hypothetical protein
MHALPLSYTEPMQSVRQSIEHGVALPRRGFDHALRRQWGIRSAPHSTQLRRSNAFHQDIQSLDAQSTAGIEGKCYSGATVSTLVVGFNVLAASRPFALRGSLTPVCLALPGL